MRAQRDELLIKKVFLAAEQGDLEKVKTFIESGGVSPKISRGRGGFWSFGDSKPWKWDNTLAKVAAKKGHFDMLKYLLERDPSVLVSRFYDYHEEHVLCFDDYPTILETAVVYGHLDIVKYLVENHNGDIFQRRLVNHPSNKYHRTPVGLAVSRGHLNIVKYFIEERRVDVDTGEPIEKRFSHYNVEPLLFRAVRFRRHNISKYLIEEKNANLHMLDKSGQNILYIAANKGDLNFIKYVLDEKEAGIDINWRDYRGRTLVHNNVVAGIISDEVQMEVLNYLVKEKKADLDILDEDYRTALHQATRLPPRYGNKVLKYLVDHGANLEKKDRDGDTPLHWAAELYDGLFKCEYLVEHGANIKQKNKEGNTPLDIAIAGRRFNSSATVEYLIGRMDDVDERNIKGETLVHKAASFNKTELLNFLVDKKHAKVDIARKNDLWTPLHCAAFWNHHEICQYLIEHGANPLAKDKVGKSPAQVATNKKVIQYIQNASTIKMRSRRSVNYSSTWIPAPSGPEPPKHRNQVNGNLRGRVTLILNKTPSFHFDSFLLITNFLIRYLFPSNLAPTNREEERKLLSNEEEILQNRIDRVAEDAIRTFLDVDEQEKCN